MIHTASLAETLNYSQRKSGKWVGPTTDQLMQKGLHWKYYVEMYDTNQGRRYLDYRYAENLVTREGIGYLLGTAFQASNGGHTIKTNFFVTQSKSSMASIATTDTASSHSNFGTEITYGSGDVSQTVRPTLTLGALTTGADAITCDNSASKAVFNHLTTITVYGLGLFSVNVGGTSSGYTGDILYGEVAYGSSLAVQTGYEVDVQATLSATAG